MARRIFPLLIILVIATGIWRLFLWKSPEANSTAFVVVYGNIDMRQVDLAFKDQERIAAVLVEEGSHIQTGQELAKLETTRLMRELAASQARTAAQQAVVTRLKTGSRSQELAQAKAEVRAAEVQLANAENTFRRRSPLKGSGAASEEDILNAQTARDVAADRLRVAQEQLSLITEGPRQEDIAQASALLEAQQAELALLRQRQLESVLIAPTAGVVRNRLLEPGDMASPQRPVLSIALTQPKWVRAYLRGPDLGRVKPGMQAEVRGDAFPDKGYAGWVGFISPTAEFTPKAVETPELRTSLVYEVRIHVNDPDDELRLGMPVTARINLTAPTKPQTTPEPGSTSPADTSRPPQPPAGQGS